jgi:hypothetical protein
VRRFRDIVHRVHLEGIARTTLRVAVGVGLSLWRTDGGDVVTLQTAGPACPLQALPIFSPWSPSDATASARLPFGTSQGHDGAFRK